MVDGRTIHHRTRPRDRICAYGCIGWKPGRQLSTCTTFPAATGSFRNGVANAYLYAPAAGFNPAATPIVSIDFSIDAILLSGGGVTDAVPVLQQGGNFYAAALLSSPSASWTTMSTTGLTAGSFGLLTSDPSGTNPNGLTDFTQNPNFSGGGLINFGFYSGHSTSLGGPGNSISEGFDNFNLTVNTAPEPASVGLLLAGCTALLMKRRRAV